MIAKSLGGRLLLGAALVLACVGSGAAHADDRVVIYLRGLDGGPLLDKDDKPAIEAYIEAWRQADEEGRPPRVFSSVNAPTYGAGDARAIASVAVGEQLVNNSGFVASSNNKVSPDGKRVLVDPDGKIEMTVKTKAPYRAIVFIARRSTMDPPTAMVPFLVDTKGEVKTHTIYIAVPALPPVPAKSLPSAFPPSKNAPVAMPTPANAYTGGTVLARK